MPRLRYLVAALGATLLLPALAACGGGSDDAADPASSPSSSGTTSSTGLSAVSFTGDVGKALTPTWHSTLDSSAPTDVTTLVKGTGGPLADGDTVQAYLWIGDGTTQKVAYSDYTNGAPESIPTNGQIGAVFTKLLAGATYGSRVALVTTPTELLGSASGSSKLGISAGDTLVLVADLVKKAAVSPTPSDDKVHDVSPSGQPKVVLTKGKPTGLDFSGVAKPAPTTPVQRVILEQGTGAAVTASDTLTVNYLGETYQAKTPFDESFSSTPLTSPLSGLIPGWSTGLVGVKVGSRVLLQIPPAAGYGAQGQGTAIPGNATLWFVIDVVKAN